MSSLFIFISLIVSLVLHTTIVYSQVGSYPLKEFIYPNFTISEPLYIDNGGQFLISQNGTFAAAISQPSIELASNYYLSIIHVASGTIVWSANRNSPMLAEDVVMLSSSGLSILSSRTYHVIWETPELGVPVAMMRLLENGNLLLLDKDRTTIWQSFDYPTDTLLSGQRLPVGSVLRSSVSQSNLSEGDYKLEVREKELILTWYGQTYWSMLNDARSILLSYAQVASMEFNNSGLYLLDEASMVVSFISYAEADCSGSFMLAVFNYSGALSIMCFVENQWSVKHSGPGDRCGFPLACGTLGLCYTQSDSCGCVEPSEITAQSACFSSYGDLYNLTHVSSNSTVEKTSVSYVKVDRVNYIGVNYDMPDDIGSNKSQCEKICSDNVSCLGYFYTSAASRCHLLKDHLVSLVTNENSDLYLKLTSSIIKKRRNNQHLKLWIPITISFVIVILIVLTILYTTKRCIRVESRQVEPDAFSIPGLPERFTYEELHIATNGFSNLIGKGGFGSVYRGTWSLNSNTTDVAVKLVNKVRNEDKKVFYTEVVVMANVRHTNLVPFHGFCLNKSNRLLVSEFISRGSLDKVLFGDNYVLNWAQRVQIAIGTARGLSYLHHSCNPRIIHLDVKPENILVTENFQAKISDFGLSRLMDLNQSRAFTVMKGTRGYLAPEWLMNDGVSAKTDVYSYGMVLMEIITGRRNIFYEEETGRTVYFPALAIRMHRRGSYMDMVDRRLEVRVEADQAERLVRVALCCLHLTPDLRPSMGDVVYMLEGEMPVWEPRFEALRYLKSYEQDQSLDSIVEQQNNEDQLPHFSLPSFYTKELSGPR